MKIYPIFDLTGETEFIESVERLLDQVLPERALLQRESPKAFFQQMEGLLPLVHHAPLKEGGNAFRILLLGSGEYAHGIGRFLSDALSRQFIPGKIVELVAARTLSFFFYPDSTKEYVLIERWIMASDPEEIPLIQERLPRFIEELRVTLLSVVKARHFLSLHSQTLGEQALVFSEVQHLSTFEEMQKIVRRLSEEKSLGEVRNSLGRLFARRPKIFDRGMFEEMQASISFYTGAFIGARCSRYISWLVCIHFYFQKKLASLRETHPLQHHLLLKLFHSKERTGIFICMNLLKENELFKKQHLLEAISRCVPNAREIEGSFLMDASNPSTLCFYLEIERAAELNALRARLPLEIKRSIQRTVNPLFMLRNEEDHMRYLIALTQEIRKAKDIPQMVIFFEEQTDDMLIFSIILVRLLKQGEAPLKDLLAGFPVRTFIREQRTMGFVGKIPKEASIFQASLPKREYIRTDHSLDLGKARQKLLSHLTDAFQQVRDYNGGFLSKQFESHCQLKTLLGPLSEAHAFALENFFFSIEPLAAQMTLSGGQLKEGFLLLLHLLETNTTHHFGSSIAGCVASSVKEKQRLRAFLDLAREACPEISYSLAHYHDLFSCIFFLPQKHRGLKTLFSTFFSQKNEPRPG